MRRRLPRQAAAALSSGLCHAVMAHWRLVDPGAGRDGEDGGRRALRVDRRPWAANPGAALARRDRRDHQRPAPVRRASVAQRSLRQPRPGASRPEMRPSRARRASCLLRRHLAWASASAVAARVTRSAGRPSAVVALGKPRPAAQAALLEPELERMRQSLDRSLRRLRADDREAGLGQPGHDVGSANLLADVVHGRAGVRSPSRMPRCRSARHRAAAIRAVAGSAWRAATRARASARTPPCSPRRCRGRHRRSCRGACGRAPTAPTCAIAISASATSPARTTAGIRSTRSNTGATPPLPSRSACAAAAGRRPSSSSLPAAPRARRRSARRALPPARPAATAIEPPRPAPGVDWPGDDPERGLSVGPPGTETRSPGARSAGDAAALGRHGALGRGPQAEVDPARAGSDCHATGVAGVDAHLQALGAGGEVHSAGRQVGRRRPGGTARRQLPRSRRPTRAWTRRPTRCEASCCVKEIDSTYDRAFPWPACQLHLGVLIDPSAGGLSAPERRRRLIDFAWPSRILCRNSAKVQIPPST